MIWIIVNPYVILILDESLLFSFLFNLKCLYLTINIYFKSSQDRSMLKTVFILNLLTLKKTISKGFKSLIKKMRLLY